MYWLLGMPHSVTAVTARERAEIDTEDTAEIVLSYSSGAIASIHVDYVRRPTRRFVEVVGEDGVVRWEFETNRLLRYAPGTREWMTEEGDPRFARNDMFAAELCEFAARVRGETDAGIGADAHQGIDVLKIALAAQHSAAEGRTIAPND